MARWGSGSFFCRPVILALCLFFTVLMVLPSRADVPSKALSAQRAQYEDAQKAIKQSRWVQYKTLRASLDDYPLALYLDYAALQKRLPQVGVKQAQDFLTRSADTPLANRFLSSYLTQLGKRRQWTAFLQVMPDAPRSTALQCYYYRAKLATGDAQSAWGGAQQLWVYGKSRPKVCDPLFNAWMKAGQLNDATVWARLLKVFDARQSSLLKYVARQGSPKLKPWSDRLLAVYRSPGSVMQQRLSAKDPHASDIATHGLIYLARYNPVQALDNWQRLQSRLPFDAEQTLRVEHAIAKRSLFAKSEDNLAWVVAAFERLEDDELVAIRLRWALEEQDWQALDRTLGALSIEARQKSHWRYWAAVADQKMGRPEQAESKLAALAEERGFYSFLAADSLHRPYEFNHQPLGMIDELESDLETADELGQSLQEVQELQANQQAATSTLEDNALDADVERVIARITELRFHENETNAQSEWYALLNRVDSPQRLKALASLAIEKGWPRKAIDAANRAKEWDALDVRFPLMYREVFEKQAGAVKVPSTELMAIARRESAFFAHARSPVGARGLMQIMPATGRQVASSIGRAHKSADLYDVQHNVLLGSTYYRQLLDRFGGNRIFALSAYNAGPHRVARWRNKAGETVPADVWIETIPFKETRRYVRAVLAYNVVFNHLMGDTVSVLSPLERQADY